MRYIIILIFFVAALLTACSKTEDPGTTTAVKVANEWWVNYKTGDSTVKITTYNTASNPDSIWVNSLDTVGNGYRFACKVKIDMNSLEFSAQNSQNISVHKTNAITITNGKILPNVGHSRTNNPTDSIYLEVQYSDEPGVTYKIAGHARTMWDTDDY
ncbi:hypothetical protein A4H97_20365 [Niastella yeongjuensis]|uniref:Lipid-binding hydrolase n=1 Tax=Niastella yeongjuensis TaxID=354355 RepID=A0A1V9FC42_9BACT|nr:lipid-binding protein [Niastella yeongjuensis]OQP55944.1 hypothetical protein A4H97_20365 [Niastella yeongjuensis]SEP26472.1 Lipid-binding putative hydrolase [Niastella yeongjuensis]